MKFPIALGASLMFVSSSVFAGPIRAEPPTPPTAAKSAEVPAAKPAGAQHGLDQLTLDILSDLTPQPSALDLPTAASISVAPKLRK